MFVASSFNPVFLKFEFYLIIFIRGFSFFSEDYFFLDPELNDPIPIDFLSHKEQYEQTVRKACIAYRKSQELQKSKGAFEKHRYSIAYIFMGSDIKIQNL